MDLQYEIELYEDLLDNYVRMFEAGQIDEDEFEQLKAAAYVELQERLADASEIDEDALDAVLGDDEEYEDEDAEYSYGDLAEFSAGSAYGSALLELAEAAGYDDLEAFVEDVADVTGNDPSDIFDLVTGEAIPDDNFSVALAEALGLDEDLTADLLVLGIEERGEDIEDYLDDEEDSDGDEEIEDETYSRVAALESELAEFQYENAVKDSLAELLVQADNLVEAGAMPPVAAEILFGSFDLDSDRIAAFSAVCNQNSVTPDQELYAMRKILKVFERLGGMINFGYSVQEEFAPVTEEDVELEQIASNYIKNNFRK